MVYCIYSGTKIDKSESNVEHIIPLSLGGTDDFTINVSKKHNSYLGSKVDGKMTQDFPNTDDFWLGHTLICQNGQLIRMSWREVGV